MFPVYLANVPIIGTIVSSTSLQTYSWWVHGYTVCSNPSKLIHYECHACTITLQAYTLWVPCFYYNPPALYIMGAKLLV